MFHQSWRHSNVFEPLPTFAIEYMLIYAVTPHTDTHRHTHTDTDTQQYRTPCKFSI